MRSELALRQRLTVMGQMITGVIVISLIGLLLSLLLRKAPPSGWMTIHPPRDVNALTTFQGSIWSGGKDGLYQISLQTGSVIDQIALEEGIDFSYTTSLEISPDGSELWIGHLAGVSCFDGQKWALYNQRDGLPDNQVLALLYQPEVGVWIATTQGLVLLDLDTGEIKPASSQLTRRAFSILYLDSHGILYAGNGYTREGGLLKYDGAKWEEITTSDGLAHPMVNAILETSNGTLYIGTGFSNQGGLSIQTGEGWKTLTKTDGLAGNKVRYLFQDQEGILWVGSEFEGIAFGGKQWSVLTPDDGLAGWEVKAMLQDQEGRLWFGTEKGLSRIEYETWRRLISKGPQSPEN